MEPNPIFQLELNQAKRNGLFWVLLLLGLAEGFSRMCMAVALSPYGRDTGMILVIPFFVSLAFYFVQFMLPVFLAWKIASQRLNEDLLLLTPMSPLDVFWGKVQFAISCGALLYVPAILVSLIATIGLLQGWWILYSVSGFLFLEYTIVISLGFMAGAKTLGKMMELVFLLGLFGIGIFGTIVVLDGVLHGWVRRDYVGIALLFFSHVFGLVSAAILFVIGVMALGSTLETRQQILGFLMAFFGVAAIAAIFIGGLFGYIVPATLMCVLYFIPLLGAVGLQGIFLPDEFESLEQRQTAFDGKN